MSIVSRIVQFVRWWLGELRALMPFAQHQTGRHHLIRASSDGGWILSEPGTGGRRLASTNAAGEATVDQPKRLKRLCQDPGGLVIELEPKAVLANSIKWPSAARHNLHEVVALELSGFVPFSSAEACFGVRETSEQIPGQLIDVELRVCPLSSLQTLAAALRHWGLSVDLSSGVVHWPDGASPQLKLAPLAGEPGKSGFDAFVWVLNAALLATVVAYPFWKQGTELDSLRIHEGQLRQEAVEVAALKARVLGVEGERDRLFAIRMKQPAAVLVLEALTQSLTDTTHLQRLELRKDRVLIKGVSADAASLVPLLEALPLLDDVQLTAQVTRSGANEQFSISARVRPEPPPKTNDSPPARPQPASAPVAGDSG